MKETTNSYLVNQKADGMVNFASIIYGINTEHEDIREETTHYSNNQNKSPLIDGT